MSNENGPDRELGLWRWFDGPKRKQDVTPLRVRGGIVQHTLDGWDPCRTSLGVGIPVTVAALLRVKFTPIDTTAKREAIRAGWRELGGKWVKDDRHPRMCELYCGPMCFEMTAKARGEWPADEPKPVESFPVRSCENGASKPVTAHMAARQAVGQMRHEAFEAGRRHEREKAAKAAKPCALKRLSDANLGWDSGQDFSDEGTAAYLLLTAVAYAKAKGLDLSDLVERMAAGVQG